MRTHLILLVILSFVTIGLYAQSSDPKAKVAGISEGSVTIETLLKAEKLEPSQPDIVIVSFSMSYPIGDDDVAEFVSKSADITSEMKENIKQLKPGTEVSFENIKAKKADKVIILESIILKILK